MAITLRVGRRGAATSPRTRRRAPAPREEAAQVSPSGALRLMTLNVAHARRQGRHQALQSESALRGNLAAIAAVIRRESPDVIALQEADGPSAWSGGFDHVATLAELAGYPHAFRGEHNPFSLGRFDLSSGTALLARVPLGAPRSLAFGESWRDTKGFVAATLSGETIAAPPIDVVSIHLDFLAERVRRLMQHPGFSIANPNNVFALLRSFCMSNEAEFHRRDADGYALWVESVLALDRINPTVAARIARALDRWRRFAPDRQQAMREALEQVGAAAHLSRDVREIVTKSLEN